MARKITVTGTTPAAIAFDNLTAKGQALMTQVGTRGFSFFDEGIVAGSGAWGEVMAGEAGPDVSSTSKGVAGVLSGTNKAGLWNVTPGDKEFGDDSDWWALTELGAAVALHAASLVVTADDERTRQNTPAEVAPAVKVCKKDASHGEHRVTRTGSYCYACDRIAAEAQKAARAAAK